MASTTYADSTYKVRVGDSLETIAQRKGISSRDLQKANPHLKPTRMQIGDTVRIPVKGRRSAPLSPKTATIKTASKLGHVVASGDRDDTIARRHGLTVEQLHRLNSGVQWNRLKIGQRVVTTRPRSNAPPKVARTPRSTSVTKARTVAVRVGDTADKIGRRVGLSGEAIRRLNPGVKWTRLQLGQVLVTGKTVVAQRKPATSARPIKATRVVKRSAATRPTASHSAKYVAVGLSSVILRQVPSSSGKRVAKLSAGTTGRVLEQRSGWVKLAFASGRAGWVRSDLLKAGKSDGFLVKSTPSAIAGRSASGLISSAKSYLGVRYRLGGTSRSGFDCSGFVGFVMRKHGVRLPRTSSEQSRVGVSVSKSQLRTGDLVFFRTNRGTRINHVGIFIGGGQFIHASSGGGRVRIDTLHGGYYQSRYATGRRVLKGRSIAKTLRPLTKLVAQHGSIALDPEPSTETPEVVNPTTGADVASP